MAHDRSRFSLTQYQLPKNGQDKTFFDKARATRACAERFGRRSRTAPWASCGGDRGVGKTSAIRNLIAELPKPEIAA